MRFKAVTVLVGMALVLAAGCGSDGEETSTSTTASTTTTTSTTSTATTADVESPDTGSGTSAPGAGDGTSTAVLSPDAEAAKTALTEADPDGLLAPIQGCIDVEQLATLAPPGPDGYDLEGETWGPAGGDLPTSSLGKLVFEARSEAERCGVQVTIRARFDSTMTPTSFVFASL